MNWERCYRLALMWVPDENEARELFMRATSESDLLRLANRWRAEQGLEPAEAWNADIPVQPLDENEYAEGDGLWRRGRLRRRLRVLGAAMAVVLVVCATTVGAMTYGETLVNPLDPAFGQTPLAIAGAETRFIVYQVERTAGSVRVWWALEGKGAAESEQFSPVLVTERDTSQGETLRVEHHPWRTEQRTVGRRVLGYSTYHLAGGAEGFTPLKLYWTAEPEAVDLPDNETTQEAESGLAVTVASNQISRTLLAATYDTTDTFVLDSGTTTIGLRRVFMTEDYLAVTLDVKSGYRPVAMRRWLAVMDAEGMFTQAYGEEINHTAGLQTLYFPPPTEESRTVTLATARTEPWVVPVEAPYVSRLVQTDTGILLHMRGMEAFYEPGRALLEVQTGQQIAVVGYALSEGEYAFSANYRVPPSYVHQLHIDRMVPGVARIDVEMVKVDGEAR